LPLGLSMPSHVRLSFFPANLAFVPGLPVYGGLARSKVNEYSGSKTALSGVALAGFTFLVVRFLLKPLAWLPVIISLFSVFLMDIDRKRH